MSANLTRRALVATASALPALAVPVALAAVGADPAIALAQRCSALWDEYGRVTSLEPTPSANATDQEWEAKWQWQDDQEAISGEWSDAFERMTVTAPTTSRGAAALIRSYLKCEANCISEEHRCTELLESLLSYLDAAA